ncbi:aldo/keto reductase [Microbacterium marinilacus]|uniref:Aldo/keto reductase n=1 Tax=Microbacterium marinilacus TaxID=415209 RepID=A0ABP7BQX7_9MICO|nr:aldo/keto reductase [Microbacterium marinilacus]MBY0689253.1 aldo/keto reductase [Microbacterium marinilacus]
MEWTRRPLGGTGLSMTPLTVGGAPLGSMPKNFGYEVAEEDGVATAVAALTGPIRSLDTSCAYSDGESERRIGIALERVGGRPDDFVLATKVTRDLRTGDFSGAQMRRAIEGSLARLGVDRVPLLYLHDPENTTFTEATARGGAVDVIRALKDEGIAGAIGVAGGDTRIISEYVATGYFDVLLTHNRWTLVNRTANAMIDLAREHGMGVVNAAVLGGGILATGAGASTRYGYREAPEVLLNAIREVERLCHEADVPLAAAALQFSTRDPRIATTIVGVSRPERIADNVAAIELDIPDALFDEIDRIAATLPADIGPR